MELTDTEKIDLILSKSFKEKNLMIGLFKNYFGDLEYQDIYGSTLLHMVARYDGDNQLHNKIAALDVLLRSKVDPNELNVEGNSFMHLLIGDEKIDMPTLRKIFQTAKSFDFDIDVLNNASESLLYYGLLHYPYDKLIIFLDILEENGFSLWKEINDYEPLEELVIPDLGNDKDKMIALRNKLRGMAEQMICQSSEKKDNGSSIKNSRQVAINSYNNSCGLRKYYNVLTEETFVYPPAYNRDDIVDELILSLAEDNKGVLLVGPSGCGKTAIICQLAYLIQREMVPNFLLNKTIIEVSVNDMVSGTTYRGDFEKRVKEIIELCVKTGAILFIDEIHEIYGAGNSSKEDKNDFASILKPYIDRQGLKVIGTTTDIEYQKYMVGSALKRRFEIITVKELEKELLIDVGINLFIDIAEKKNISLGEVENVLRDIVDILVELTSESHRKYNDKENNPSLIKQIISRSFAYPVVQDRDYLSLSDISKSIRSNERIYDTARDSAIYQINELCTEKVKTRKRTSNIINFMEYITR